MSQLNEDESKDNYIPPRGTQDWPVHLILDKKAKDISAGEGWGAAILEDETIVTWGVGTSGEMAREVPELGKKTSMQVVISEVLTPKPPAWNGLAGKRKVAAISCGGFHFLAVVREVGMSVYGSGLNQYGQLGLGDQVNRYELTRVSE
jgi:alpha-tubulin suppressor-like RCC1 family protein